MMMFEERNVSLETVEENETDYLAVLDKMLELEKEKNKNSAPTVAVCVVGALVVTIFAGVLCYRLLKTNLAMDSILSTLLAFFSIFISIFFYFKADETSSNFYKASYDIMKDVSVALGKIEERFGEKLNSLNDKVEHLDSVSSEKSEEIREQKDDKDRIISELMDRANLDQEEKKKIRKELADSEKQIERLKRQQREAQMEADFLRRIRGEVAGEVTDRWEPNNMVLVMLLRDEKEKLSIQALRRLMRLGYIDEEGNVDKERVLKELETRNVKILERRP